MLGLLASLTGLWLIWVSKSSRPSQAFFPPLRRGRVITDRTLDCCCHAALPSCVRPSSEAPLAHQDNHPPGRRADRWAVGGGWWLMSGFSRGVLEGGRDEEEAQGPRQATCRRQPDTEVFQWGRGVCCLSCCDVESGRRRRRTLIFPSAMEGAAPM